MQQTDPNIDEYAGYIYKFIQQYIQLSEQEFNQFLPLIEVRCFPKRAILLEYGEIDNYLNLVVKGLVRKFVRVGKNEKTMQLAIEGHIIQSESSFHARIPSIMTIEAIEPSTLVSMKYDNVQLALKTIPGAEQVAWQMITYMFIKKDARYFAQLTNTTRQCFLHYVTNHPHMVQRVPQKILASYLDIKPETFSRLKHLLKKNN